jgi:type IV secretory pathway VirB3-like protein
MDPMPAEAAQRRREDTLHVGATRPAMLLGLPIAWAVPLLGGAYMIQTNVTGFVGIAWAAAWLVPGYAFARLAVRKSFFGLDVVLVWVRANFVA